MNKVYLSGRLKDAPNLRYSANEKAYAQATLIANSGGYKTFITLKFFGDLAEQAGELVENDLILVTGAIKVDSFQKDGDSKKTYYTNVVVDDIQLLSYAGDDENLPPK